MDRLTGLEVFVAVADAGSFTAAASRLRMSPQMVARHVGALEQRLGHRLVNRTTRRQSLTAVGMEYLDRCRRILEELAGADALVQGVDEEPRGKLRINAPVTFGRCVLMPLLGNLLRQHPRLQIELALSDQVIDVLDGGYEAIIRIGTLAPDLEWVARPLRPYGLIACAAPDYLAASGVPLTPSALDVHACLGFTSWPEVFHRTWRFERDQLSSEVAVGGRLQVNDWDALLRAALAGLGILIGYELALEPYLSEGRLIRVLPDFSLPERPMHVLHAPHLRKSARLKCLLDTLEEACGNN